MEKRGIKFKGFFENHRRGDSDIMQNIIPIIIVISFTCIFIAYIATKASGTSYNEENYAKQIALAIEKAKSGTEINLDVSDLYKIAKKNNFNGKIIDIDNSKNLIHIRLINGAGYSYKFFNSHDILWNIIEKGEGLDKKQDLIIILS